MTNNIKYYTRSVYGNDNIYIADSEQAQLVFALTGTKTLLPHQKSALEALGFTFEEVLAPKKN